MHRKHFAVAGILVLSLAGVMPLVREGGLPGLAGLERRALTAAAPQREEIAGTGASVISPDGAVAALSTIGDLSGAEELELQGPSATAAREEPRTEARPTAEVLLAVGDIVGCGKPAPRETAALLDPIPGTIAMLGDSVYNSGTPAEFADCYQPTWGRHKARTRPVPGNHDYGTPGAAGYFGYFGGAAGDPKTGYYSYDLGSWHVVALNSNCGQVGGCQSGSPQERWLRTDLAASSSPCTLAYAHHPRFSSGPHGDVAEMEPIWQALYDAGAEAVLSGHDHLYERFAPQDPRGRPDPARGIRQFIVGTGGISLYKVKTVRPNSEARIDDSFGVLKLTLHPSGYDWEFIPAAGGARGDAGSTSCR